eukprot:CAMPEP_0197659816 /NCGR_PEP_ID=MMETSP1338-20131121/49243_1 /TAXON_ID=43686 ORGANISM="Pelagodinium beii, Strain RCC1491" /NCGR_SAMPLE_ID=MMETSP1338 /ASSEMBLY_ACC=CAM_ASM_000754 /LENGTH=240 /DNA_ID=CAMNT_0043236929 /DNA_START=30 /DNA_END=749 /DNA_ORIENTATION=+
MASGPRKRLLGLCLALGSFSVVFVAIPAGSRKNSKVPLGVYVNDIKVGDQLQGDISEIRPYGAFVDFGCENNIHGLVPSTRIMEAHVRDVSAVCWLGQKVTVWVTDIKREKKKTKVALTMVENHLRPRINMKPFQALSTSGAELTGIVKQIVSYGMFVGVRVGSQKVTGLLHVSKIGEGFQGDVRKIASVGEMVKVTVALADEQTGKIHFGMRRASHEERPKSRRGRNKAWPENTVRAAE